MEFPDYENVFDMSESEFFKAKGVNAGEWPVGEEPITIELSGFLTKGAAGVTGGLERMLNWQQNDQVMIEATARLIIGNYLFAQRYLRFLARKENHGRRHENVRR